MSRLNRLESFLRPTVAPILPIAFVTIPAISFLAESAYLQSGTPTLSYSVHSLQNCNCSLRNHHPTEVMKGGMS